MIFIVIKYYEPLGFQFCNFFLKLRGAGAGDEHVIVLNGKFTWFAIFASFRQGKVSKNLLQNV